MMPANPYDLGSIARDNARRRNDPKGWALAALSERLAALERRVRALEAQAARDAKVVEAASKYVVAQKAYEATSENSAYIEDADDAWEVRTVTFKALDAALAASEEAG